MPKIEIPHCLISVTNLNFDNLESHVEGNALFLFKLNHPFETQLSVFKTPFCFLEDYGLGVGRFKDRMKNVGWYIRGHNLRVKEETTGPFSPPFSQDLWDDFSEKLIMGMLRDKKGNYYEIKCDQTFATSATYGINSKDTYFFSGSNPDLKKAFDFSSKKLLENFEDCNFSEFQIKKLSKFMYEDFTTLKHSEESRRVGQEADSVFFPG